MMTKRKLITLSILLAHSMLCCATHQILNAVHRFLPKNPTIIEAGVYNGSDTLIMSKRWPQGKIYGFEPVPYLFNKANTILKKQKNATLSPYALSDENGETTFNCSAPPYDASGSILKPKIHHTIHPNVHFNTTITVETITLDSWALSKGITKVDMLWLDLQGLELTVLKAATSLLPSVKVIITEVNYQEIYENAGLFTELTEFLAAYGFKLLQNIETIKGYWGDAIFIHE